MSHEPLIKIEKYAVQTATLENMGRTKFGDATIVSTSTINLLVYTDTDKQDQTSPEVALKKRTFAVIPTPTPVKTHDHLKDVTDQFGNVVLANSRVLSVESFCHWKYEPRFVKCEIDVDLD